MSRSDGAPGRLSAPDHLARFVVDSVAQLDLSVLYASMHRTMGKMPPHPQVDRKNTFVVEMMVTMVGQRAPHH